MRYIISLKLAMVVIGLFFLFSAFNTLENWRLYLALALIGIGNFPLYNIEKSNITP